MLPDIRFWVDNAHVGLVGAAIYEHTVVHLQECILGIVLPIELE